MGAIRRILPTSIAMAVGILVLVSLFTTYPLLDGIGAYLYLSADQKYVLLAPMRSGPAARAGTRGQKDWTYERVMETFPRLSERLTNLGSQLSGELAHVAAIDLGDGAADEPAEGAA